MGSLHWHSYNKPVNRFYEEGEAEEILRRALHQSDTGAIDRAKLFAMAAELGISEEAVARAEQQMASEREAGLEREREEQDRLAFKRHRRSRFWADLGSYLSFNAFLVAIWWSTGRGYFWPGWVLVVWGLNVVGDFFNAFLSFSERDFERWKRKRAKREFRRSVNEKEVEVYIKSLPREVWGSEQTVVDLIRDRFDLTHQEAKELMDDYQAEKRRA